MNQLTVDIKKKLEIASLRVYLGKIRDSLGDDEEFKSVLIDCLLENGVIQEQAPKMYESDQEDPDDLPPINELDLREDILSIKNKTQPLIDVPTNKTNIIIDGKQYTIDLVKISRWNLEKQTRQLKYYKTGIENINSKVLSIQLISSLEPKIMETIGAIYWNITVHFDKRNFKNFKSANERNAYQLLSILYGTLYNTTSVSKDELYGSLLKEYQLPNSIVSGYFAVFKNILKTSFISELLEDTSNAKISKIDTRFDKNLTDTIIAHLVDKNILPDDPYTYGALLYYLDKLSGKKSFLSKIQTKLGINNERRLKHSYSVLYNYIERNDKLKQDIIAKLT